MEQNSFQLKLKIFWCKNFLGLSINQIGLDQHYFVTPYYFWPKTKAWEQLKLKLDSKFWLPQTEKLRILKISSDVMNYWLSYRNTKTVENFKKDFPEVEVLRLRK